MRKAGLLLALAAVGVLGVLTTSAGAAPGSAASLKGVTAVSGGAVENLKPASTPLGVTSAPATFVVQLGGDPVTVADANSKNAGNGPLSAGQKNSLKEQLKDAQAPVAQQIKQLGGVVTGSFQSVYNGLAVQISAKKANDLAAIPGVTGVFPTYNHTLQNIHGIPLIKAPEAWGGTPGFTGAGMKIGDIDTGLDYTHADFGGPGTTGAWANASAMSTVDPTLTCMTPDLTPCFGPDAPKVKGGTDLVGNDYNADGTAAQQIPHPDPNPLDCNGHGTHTAGTAAGFGVLSDGSTYTGPYNATTVSGHSWNVGPGVAPQADLYAIRVFGCNGSVNDTVLMQAMEWAVNNHLDAINMSLGAPFGSAKSPDAVAASNTAKDGVIVVSASGNNGPAPYITSSPGSGQGTLAVAANDPTQSFPAATLTLTKADSSSDGTRTAIDANGATITPGTYNLKVIYSTPPNPPTPGVISLGCSAAADGGANSLPANTIIVVARGTCARVAKAIFGQQAGAAGVIMVNNSTGFPPFEGKITNDPDPPGPPLFGGFNYTVTIPFLGVQGASNPSASAAAAQLEAADGGTVALAPTTLTNPGFLGLASFSSFGPRSGDSALRPNVTAPGVSIASAGMGTGSEAVIESGTSMATPHTTGTAALVKEAHPDWGKVAYWNAAITNTANPSSTGVAGYSTLGAGTGLVDAFNATHTQVVALGDKNDTSLDFGLYANNKDFNGHSHVKLVNFGSTPATFNVSDVLDQGSPHTVSFAAGTVTVPANGDVDVPVALNVPIATAGDAYSFNSVAGLVRFTPVSGGNSGIQLDVPYLLVPQASSDLKVQGVGPGQLHVKPAPKNTPPATTLTVNPTLTNDHGASVGVADWFAWGLKDGHDHGLGSDDLLNAGVQSFPTQAAPSGVGTGWLIFAITTAHRWSNPAEDEFDTYVDVNGDGVADYDVIAVDFGAISTGTSNGEDVVAVAPLNPDGTLAGGFSVRYLAGANFNGSTMELPVDFSQLCRNGFACISSGTPVSYTTAAFGLEDGSFDFFNDTASYNLFHPVFSNNVEDVVAPGDTASDPTTIDLAQWAATPQLGFLVLSQNNVTHHNHNEAMTFKADLK